MAFAQFQRQAQQLITALEARGRHFLLGSEAKITVSQLEQEGTSDILYRLVLLPKRLRLIGEQHLELAEARLMFNSPLLDTLCSVLKRVQWHNFAS